MTDDTQQPNEQQGEGFGFQAQAKNEKYNTEFLVNNLEKDKQRTKLIVLGVIVALLGAVGILALLSGGEDKPTPKTADQVRAEAAAKAEDPARDTPKPADAPKPPEAPAQ